LCPILAALAAAIVASPARAHEPAPVAFSEIGIPYAWFIEINDHEETRIGADHVGAWSWDEDSFPATARGWTHTSKWIQLDLTRPAAFTLTLQSQACVPWPSPADPNRLAGTNLFPSFTLYRGWDTDPGVTYDTNGVRIDQLHTFNNRGDIEWAEDLRYLDHLENTTTHSATRTWILAAGHYTLNLGGNSPSTLAEGRQGFHATLLTEPAPMLAVKRSGDDLVVRWPEAFSGYQLQTADQLSGAWMPAPGAASVSDGFWTQAVPMGAGPQFFRLRR
jgi:hypothetical protein